MIVDEALKITQGILHSLTLKGKDLEAMRIIDRLIEFNLCELIEESVTILSSIPKEEPQELAITLTMILEGDTDGNN